MDCVTARSHSLFNLLKYSTCDTPSQIWGDYASLYHTLTPEQVQALERAIFARKLGRFREAERIFDAELPSTSTIPVLALEKSLLFSRLGLEPRRFAVLQDVLQAESKWQAPASARVRDLIYISWVEARALSVGNIQTALREARAFRNMWEGGMVQEWTDVEFGCALAYFSIIKTCRLHSKWVDVGADLNFSPSPTTIRNVTLGQIIQVLLERKMWHVATNFIRIHEEFFEDDAKVGPFRKLLLLSCATLRPNDKSTDLAILNARLFLVELMLTDSEKSDEARALVDEASNQIHTMSWIRTMDQPRYYLQKVWLNTFPLQDIRPVSKLLTLAHAVERSGDRLVETQILSRILLLMNQVEHRLRDDDWYRQNDELIARYAVLHDIPEANVMLRAITLSRRANNLGTADDYTTHSAYLHRLALFEAEYPEFDVPDLRRDFYRGADIALRRLGRPGEARTAVTKMDHATAESAPDPTQFFRLYREKPFDEWAPHLLDLILQWMDVGLKSGNLPIAKAAELLLIPAEDIKACDSASLTDVVSCRSTTALAERLYGRDDPVEADIWEQRLERYESWLWQSPTHVKRSIRHTVLGDLQQARCASVNKYAMRVTNDEHHRFDEDLQLDVRLLKLRENDRLLHLRQRLDPESMSTSPEDLLSREWSSVCDRVNLSTAYKAYRTGVVTDDILRNAQEFFESFLHSGNYGMTKQLVTMQQIATCRAHRYRIFGTCPPDAPLDAYEEYDKVYQKQRLARSIMKGADDLVARAYLVAQWSFSSHYDNAIGYCLESLGASHLRNSYHRHVRQDISFVPPSAPPSSRSNIQLMNEIINWTQKKKGRSVSEALGAELIVPQAVLAKVQQDGQARNLLSREAECQLRIDRKEGDILELNQTINAIRREMRSCASLEEIMSLRDGRSLTSAQIRPFVESLGPDVVVVDYVSVPTACSGSMYNIIPMVYQRGVMTKAKMVEDGLHLQGIKLWIDSYLEIKRPGDKPLHTNDHSLKELYPLIATVVELSKEGEPIVICPTDILFRLPLHAIELPDGRAWIERNPIIYTQSLTILRLCQTSAAHLETLHAPKLLAAQALSDADREKRGAADMAFTSRTNACLLQGESLTRASFLQAATEADLVHFYGHVFSGQGDPLDQHLAIRKLASERVTVRDLFDLRLRKGAHVNLIGCQSGRSQAGVNDDLFGLSTALMSAGAASIVATLWSIQMRDAAVFQERLFDELIKQSETQAQKSDQVNEHNRQHRRLNLAIAVQQAVIQIMRDEEGRVKAPYHWAGFFLQGCWDKFPVIQISREG